MGVELLDQGADPTVQDSKGRVPFDVCLSRGARRAFRAWRDQNEDAWDWCAARIPGDIVNRQEGNRKRGNHNGKGKKSKTDQKHLQQHEVVLPPSTSVSVDVVDEVIALEATRPQKHANKERPCFSSTRQSQMPRKGL